MSEDIPREPPRVYDPEYCPTGRESLVAALTELARLVPEGHEADLYKTVRGALAITANRPIRALAEGSLLDDDPDDKQWKMGAEGVFGELMPSVSVEEIAQRLSAEGDPISPAHVSGTLTRAFVKLKFLAEKMSEEEIVEMIEIAAEDFVDLLEGGFKMGAADENKLQKLFEDLAVKKYTEWLESSREFSVEGEEDLTPEEIEELRAHPEIVKNLDGFKEYYEKYKSALAGPKKYEELRGHLSVVMELDAYRLFLHKKMSEEAKKRGEKLGWKAKKPRKAPPPPLKQQPPAPSPPPAKPEPDKE